MVGAAHGVETRASGEATSVQVTGAQATSVAAGTSGRSDDSRRSPGRPRSAEADQAITEAVLDLLDEGATVETLSVEAVAVRAGVGKATIYRRWAGKEALVVDAIARVKGPLPEPVGDSVRADLVRLLTPVRARPDERLSRIMSCLVPGVRDVPERYRLYQQLVEPRREAVRRVLHRGIDRGELRADTDVEVALTVLTAPVLLQRMLRWHPELDEESLPQRVVDTVLAGLAAD